MQIEEYIEAKNKFQKEIQLKGKDMLLPLFKELLGDCSQITGVAWAQYTPGFCDGEPCTFRFGEIEYYLNVPPPTEVKCSGYSCEEMYPIGKTPKFCSECGKDVPDEAEEVKWTQWNFRDKPEYAELYKRLEKFEDTFQVLEDVLESVFGDPAEIWCYDMGEGLQFEVDEDYDCGY
jgi:hypothetical protein